MSTTTEPGAPAVDVLAPAEARINEIWRQELLEPFADEAVAFVRAFSSALFAHPSARQYPELVALAYWFRSARLEELASRVAAEFRDRRVSPRGVVFHVAPANVDTMFVYSGFLSLLMGNVNVIRVSSEASPQLRLLVSVLNALSGNAELAGMANRFLVLTYGHDSETTRYFSERCQMRVIWGGNETVRRIRAVPLNPYAKELAFPDRFSMSLIKASAFLAEPDKDALLERFYNDSFWFGQNACSSPRLVVWVGEANEVLEARREFWRRLASVLEARQVVVHPGLSIEKLAAQYEVAMQGEATELARQSDSAVHRVGLSGLDRIDRSIHVGGGFFLEARIATLRELSPAIAPQDQTVTVFGFSAGEIERLVRDDRPRGLDRFVPVGSALEFSTVWDGHDLLREFTREVSIAVPH